MEATFPNNVLVFILFSIVNTILSLKVPPKLLDYRRWLYKAKKWEANGTVYQRIFKVKRWKDALPELSDFIKTIFPRKRIAAFDKNHMQKYLLESCRAELTHWGIILSSFLFGIWNDFIKTALMVLLAIGLNLPYVIIQRYNRPRLIKFIAYSDEKKANENKIGGMSTKDGNMSSILFISADDTGHGHKSITQALRQQIVKLNPNIQVSIVDGFSLGKKIMRVISKLYNPLIVSVPALWGLIYRAGNHSVRLINAFVSKNIKSNLIRCLEEIRPDVIIPVHGVYVGSILNILEKEKINIPVIPFIADFDNVSSLWADKRAEYTLCPSAESKKTMLSLGIPEDKLQLVDFPVREAFCDPSPAAPREGRILAENGAAILLISGSQGSWRTFKMAKALLKGSNCHISVIAGNNVSLKKYLEKKLSLYIGSRIQVYGFTKDIKKRMLEADILIVRASPNVVMEAVTLCKPIIVVGALKGQEEKNPEYIVKYNLGTICENIKELPMVVSELLSQNGKKLKDIYDSQIRFRNLHAAQDIVEFVTRNGRKTAGGRARRSESGEDTFCVMEKSNAN
ncbi:UDP-N-acetylglucosamine:LPS N-acetylglucosamine transferase [Sporobacter termitidis DSM 10068]|uniref:Glycosyl-4,4'-diaponeurosporenoate acyltransferase n=1 Tax=Sporobacter termitidis DSM 10068 TaxID=1123282 RepID=A0A1M5WJX0_9FIRM|nr:glycosyltransferase [Sporobacter termitidis]SHH87732.1 UDP-N-acetylglucosamine:LPS N-acetylglucosamine transferase [Sporobacter termitidis DSM 10068]